jgi:hypothetical protein
LNPKEEKKAKPGYHQAKVAHDADEGSGICYRGKYNEVAFSGFK